MKPITLAAFALGVTIPMSSLAVQADEERNLRLEDVPQAVLNAALVAVPGIVLSEAEIESSKTGDVYELEGEAVGKEYEIHIAADGTVIGVEMDDDENGDGDDDDQHDDDDDDDDDDKHHDHRHDHDTTDSDVKKDND